ncbi:MAG: hypothetical protein ACREOQ_22170 [Gemmatimonadales bacterium]
MPKNDEWPRFGIGALIAVGVIGGILAVGWAVAQIIPAIGVAAGLATALAATGVAGAGVAAWWAPTAAIGLGGGGAAVLFFVLMKTTREAAKDPYRWTLPLLGIGASLMLDLARDYAIDNQLLKILLTALLAFFVVVAGACYESEQRLWKVVGTMLLLLPPAALLTRNLDPTSLGTLWSDATSMPRSVWLRLLGFLTLGLVVVGLGHLDARSQRKPALGR